MIRRIHPHGPAVGEYVPGLQTDIRATFDRERNRLAKARVLALAAQVPADVIDTTLHIARDGAVFL